jgi:hypothetical protein
VPTIWSIAGTGDFNGDGLSDIAWRDTSGNVAMWFMNGTSVSNLNTAGVGNVPSIWTIQDPLGGNNSRIGAKVCGVSSGSRSRLSRCNKERKKFASTPTMQPWPRRATE